MTSELRVLAGREKLDRHMIAKYPAHVIKKLSRPSAQTCELLNNNTKKTLETNGRVLITFDDFISLTKPGRTVHQAKSIMNATAN